MTATTDDRTMTARALADQLVEFLETGVAPDGMFAPDGSITAITVYCTGDWSPATIAEHRAAVTLLRP